MTEQGCKIHPLPKGATSVKRHLPSAIRRPRGFTLVELLVVIAIIGILVALLLPAVQAAREAARRTQCKNNLRQIALGFLLHEDAHGHLPHGGWGYMWMSHPDRGFGIDQPGGWGYNILPFIEETALHDLGKGLSAQQQLETNAQLHGTPVETYHCPSRRQAIPYPVTGSISFVLQPLVSGPVEVGARNDYAANAGEGASSRNGPRDGWGPGPGSLQAGENWGGWPAMELATGIIANHAVYGLGQISDGTTKTYLVGEKYLLPQHYDNGRSLGDDQSVYSGDERDVVRFTLGLIPSQDRPGLEDTWGFGSAHSAGFHMSMCDGSVQTIGYGIAPITHRLLSNRSDGEQMPDNPFN
jgi:prepilin-type N-terminal cleavage/methylation domain-containing protein